jgi:sec-independent protein translocase protein TatC
MAENNKLLEAPDDPANEQPLVSHLIELRNRTVKASIAVLVIFACLSPFMKQIFDFLSQPLMVALPQGVKLLATGVVAPFMVPLKVTLFVAFLIALPYVLYQLWAYVAPALYRREKRLALPILVSSIVMFAVGMAYCYFIVFRMVFQFIAGFSPDSVNFAPDIDSYFSFVLTMFVAFGLTFEVPIVVMVLNHVGLASYEKLVIVGAFVIAAIFTPPDVLSQLLLALPLVILFQAGIWLVKFFGKSQDEIDGMPKDDEDEE